MRRYLCIFFLISLLATTAVIAGTPPAPTPTAAPMPTATSDITVPVTEASPAATSTPIPTPTLTPTPAPSPSASAPPSIITEREKTAAPTPKPSVKPGARLVKVGQEAYFSIFWQKTLVGYSHFVVEKELQLAGERFFIIGSQSRIKMGMGSIDDLQFDSRLTVRADDLTPTFFTSTQRAGKRELTLECLFSKTLLAQKVTSSGRTLSFFHPLTTPPMLFFNNLWGRVDTNVEHYWLLSLVTPVNRAQSPIIPSPVHMLPEAPAPTLSSPPPSADASPSEAPTTTPSPTPDGSAISPSTPLPEPAATGSPMPSITPAISSPAPANEQDKQPVEQLPAPAPTPKPAYAGSLCYDPVLQSEGDLALLDMGKVRLTVDGKPTTCRRLGLVDFWGQVMMTVWTNPANGQIVQMEATGNSLVFRPSNSAVVAQVNKTHGLDLWSSRVVRSDYLFTNAKDLNEFKVNITASLRGGNLENRTLLGYQENFEGKNDASGIDGALTIRTSTYEGEGSASFPLSKDKLSPELEAYLAPQPLVEADDLGIRTKALELTRASSTVWDAVRAICNWVDDEIEPGSSLPSARLAFETRVGNTESKAMLAVALCRASRIPARPVGGIVYDRGDFVPHHWIEVYVGDGNWAAADPNTGELGTLDATHMALWQFGDVYAMNLNVEDFKPKPPARVAFFNRELTWPVGEERTYILTRGDKVVGKEIALIRGMELYQDQESYHFTIDNIIGIEGEEIRHHADMRLTTQGLPLDLQLMSSTAGKEISQDLRFEPKTIIESLPQKDNGEPFLLHIPFSWGTYVADSRFLAPLVMLGGQIPTPEVGKTYHVNLFVPETLASREVSFEAKGTEIIVVQDQAYACVKLESEEGLVLWIAPGGLTVQVKLPGEDLVAQLAGRRTIIEELMPGGEQTPGTSSPAPIETAPVEPQPEPSSPAPMSPTPTPSAPPSTSASPVTEPAPLTAPGP